jgi:hypothetical protein
MGCLALASFVHTHHNYPPQMGCLALAGFVHAHPKLPPPKWVAWRLQVLYTLTTTTPPEWVAWRLQDLFTATQNYPLGSLLATIVIVAAVRQLGQSPERSGIKSFARSENSRQEWCSIKAQSACLEPTETWLAIGDGPATQEQSLNCRQRKPHRRLCP